jgi:hypothetical protein
VTFSGTLGGAGQLTGGTISGLVEGAIDGTGLIVQVTDTPPRQPDAGGWRVQAPLRGGDAFTVLGGEIVFADLVFIVGFYERLWFCGHGGSSAYLVDIDSCNCAFYGAGATAISAAAVPLPAASRMLGAAFALLGVGGLRRLAKQA